MYNSTRKLFISYEKFRYNNYICDIETNISNDPKKFWDFVRSKKKQNGLPINMKLDGNTSNNINNTAELFAYFFKDVYAQESNPVNYVNPEIIDESECISITDEDIIFAVKKLKNKFYDKLDGVPSVFYKNL